MHLDYDESVADLVDMDLVYDEPAADRVYMDLDYDEPLEDHARFGEDMTIKDDITTGDDSSFRDDTPFTYDTPFGDPTSVRDPAPVAPPAPQPNFPQPPQRPGEIEMATINQPGDSMSPIKIPLEDGTVIYRCPIPSCGKDYQTHSGYSKHKMRELKRTVPCYHFGCDYFSYRAGQTRTHFLSDHPGFSLPPHLEVGVRGETVRYQD
ncbi:hypothetical protein QBC44DRAFT_28704 [Cladorrhinum sp. PSN332]|nr:hypothetical protein QBC44DRAFT_28704 [Cladorrhinum sp. PSN332]